LKGRAAKNTSLLNKDFLPHRAQDNKFAYEKHEKNL
jgi:hypothetical protein